MAEVISEAQALESTTIGIYRTATVVKGGRRFSFAALVVVGDRRGNIGIGYGKAPGVPAAIEKAQKDARKQLVNISLKSGTIPHPVTGRFGSSKVRMLPAAPGTGVVAGGTVRAVLEMAGVNDCLTKAYGSTNKKNLCKAVMDGLLKLRTQRAIEQLRGMELGKTEVDERIEAAHRFLAQPGEQEQGEAPAKAEGEPGGQSQGEGEATSQAQATAEPAVEQPAEPEAQPESAASEPSPSGEQAEQPGNEQTETDPEQKPGS